jgi:hypothetical protein
MPKQRTEIKVYLIIIGIALIVGVLVWYYYSQRIVHDIILIENTH